MTPLSYLRSRQNYIFFQIQCWILNLILRHRRDRLNLMNINLFLNDKYLLAVAVMTSLTNLAVGGRAKAVRARPCEESR